MAPSHSRHLKVEKGRQTDMLHLKPPRHTLLLYRHETSPYVSDAQTAVIAPHGSAKAPVRPFAAFKISGVNGREAQESGLRPKMSVAVYGEPPTTLLLRTGR